ncbi:MAG: hypothetical protein ACO3X1_15715, partial [Burkholderiaceae bacterium]
MLTTDGEGRLAWTPALGGDLARLDAVSGGLAGTITDQTITNDDIAASAAIVDSKLARITTAGKVSGSAIDAGTIAGTAAFTGSGGIVTDGVIHGRNHFIVGSDGNTAKALQFTDQSGTHYVGLKAADSLSDSFVWTLPAADGPDGAILKTDGQGKLSWFAPVGLGDMQSGNNLSDVADKAAARLNLELGKLATMTTIGSAEVANESLMAADIAPSAGIETSKLSGSVLAISNHGLGSLAGLHSVSSALIDNDSILNTDIAESAGIATSKLSGSVFSVANHGLGTLATLNGIG